MPPKVKVYFLKLNELNKINDLLPKFAPPLGVKVHFGEEGNITFVPAGYIKQIVRMVKDTTLIECSVLYKSPRRTAKGHRQVALSHGFNFAPLDFLDGETGDEAFKVNVMGKHFKEVYLGQGLEKYKSLLVISHFKGHGLAGFGGAIKNLGMGLASRRGKLAQHATIKHEVKEEKCLACGQCIANCPVGAISYNEKGKARIDQNICISCSKCISVCPEEAISIPWGSTPAEIIQERIAEYALAATRGRECFYLNFLINITKDCDCFDIVMEKLTPDIGVLASNDPVAIDQASYDLTIKQFSGFKDRNGDYQLEHGQDIGLGRREYDLINL